MSLIEVLDGEIVEGNYPYEYVEGNIYTDSTLEEGRKLSKGDIVITGHIKKLQKRAATPVPVVLLWLKGK